MGIGTALGAYFEDDFHHQAGINGDPSADNNTIDPEVDPDGMKPKPSLDIMPLSDKMPFPDNNNPDTDFKNRFGNLPPSGILNDLKKPGDPTPPLVRRISDTRLYVSPMKETESVPEPETFVNPLADQLVRGVAGVIGDIATIPERAIGAAATYNETGNYNPAPILEAATLGLTPPVGKLGSEFKAAMESKSVPAEQESVIQPHEAFNSYRDLHEAGNGGHISYSRLYEDRASTQQFSEFLDHVDNYHSSQLQEGPSPFEQVVRGARRSDSPDTEEALRQIHAVLYPDEASANAAARAYRPDNLPHESFDELMVRMDREDLSRTAEQAKTATFQDYGKVQVADRGFGSFLFKAGDSKALPLNVSERNDGKTIHVGWIGDATGKAINSFDKGTIKGLFKALADKYPNAEEITGFRVSGARRATGSGSDTARMAIPGRKRTMPKRKSIEDLSSDWAEMINNMRNPS